MPGAGKGIFRRTVQGFGYPVIIMGDEVREEIKRRKLKPTPENFGKTMLNLREIEGPSTIAKRTVTRLENQASRIVVIDGIRSLIEVDTFKEHFPNFILVGIYASPKTRYHRLFRRGRNDDPTDWGTFMERDVRELEIGVGSVISMADYMIVNEGTIRQLKYRASQFMKKVIEGRLTF